MAKGGNAMRWSQQRVDEYLSRRHGTPAPTPTPAPAPPARNKYSSEKVEVDGQKFDSRKEARRWAELCMMLDAGQITDLQRQVAFELAPAVHLAGEARKKPALRYWADATYMQAGQLVVEDTKSESTRKKEAYRIKKHLMATVHKIHIKEV